MATLSEYFFRELAGWGSHGEIAYTTPQGRTVTVTEKINFDERAGVNFVSFLLPEGTFTPALAARLLQDRQLTLDRRFGRVETTMAHPVIDPEGIDPATMPLSTQSYMFIDDYLSPDDRAELVEFASSLGVVLRVRDRRTADFKNSHEVPLAFISHDSRDKEAVARPLADRLASLMCPVWYDEYSLRVGQSLRESIDDGLSKASKCIVVISQHFIENKGWTKAEFNAIMSKHISAGGSVILPVWHEVTKEEVAAYSSMFVDIKGLATDLGTDELARRLYREIQTLM